MVVVLVCNLVIQNLVKPGFINKIMYILSTKLKINFQIIYLPRKNINRKWILFIDCAILMLKNLSFSKISTLSEIGSKCSNSQILPRLTSIRKMHFRNTLQSHFSLFANYFSSQLIDLL